MLAYPNLRSVSSSDIQYRFRGTLRAAFNAIVSLSVNWSCRLGWKLSEGKKALLCGIVSPRSLYRKTRTYTRSNLRDYMPQLEEFINFDDV